MQLGNASPREASPAVSYSGRAENSLQAFNSSSGIRLSSIHSLWANRMDARVRFFIDGYRKGRPCVDGRVLRVQQLA